MEQKWITPIVIGASVVVGAAVYLAKPMLSRSESVQPQAAATEPVSQDGISPSPIARCVGPVDQRVSRTSLNDKYRWAHTLVEQKLFDAALPELRYIASVDPGFPGINLDISDSLLQLKHPDQARVAINSQLAISECVSKLPTDALDTYCKTELSQTTTDSCRSQLAYIGRAAQLQAALVHLDLGHQAVPEATASTADLPAMPVAHVARLALRPKRAAGVSPAAHKNSPDKTLIDGDGTDLALGAYSKQ